MPDKLIHVFNTNYQEFIYVRTYSRWLEEEKRRESWKETVTRYCNFMKEELGDKISDKELKDAFAAICTLEVMPSMRALWSAGPAARECSFAIYNCSFTTIEKLKDFAEILFILMNGAGAGFSVERKYVNNLPVIKEKNNSKKVTIIFEDSKLGWAKGFEEVLNCLWEGTSFECDYSKIRPRGSRLKTFGGRASGPEPLISLVNFVLDLVEKNRGFQLQPIDVHDICCKIAEIVVVGGTRRSALLSLSDLTDNQLANAKMGDFYKMHPQRQLANNSVAYTRTPDIVSFIDEWKNLYRSKSGERGIFNRVAAQRKATENHRRDGSKIIGTNPCGEIIMRSKSTCNLTEVIVRPNDDFNSLKRKVQIATMLGTWQASLTNFKYVDSDWKINSREEALLGVSLSGVCDNPILGTVNDTAKKWLSDLKHVAIHTNKKIAIKIGINRAAAITCVKPSGTVSQLVDCAPGLHSRITATGYYIRRVRISVTDPLYKLMKDSGFEMKCEVGQSVESATTFVAEFPCKAPKETFKQKRNAKEQLEFWKMYHSFWCEHNPSVTITVEENEWLETAAWVYKNFDEIGGLTFLPAADHVYQLAPFEDIDKETYDELIKKFPKIDFSKLSEYEAEDMTTGAKELACAGGACELR